MKTMITTIAAVGALLVGCGDDEPSEQDRRYASLYCTQSGLSMYSEEFENCVENQLRSP